MKTCFDFLPLRPATLTRRTRVPERWLRDEVNRLNDTAFSRAVQSGKAVAAQAKHRLNADVNDLMARGRPRGTLSKEEQIGRQSGSLEWRQARAEV